jgi:carbonic anhydrase
VTLELTVDFLDHAAHEAIDQWRQQHEASGGSVHVHDVGALEVGSAVDGPPTRAFTPVDKRVGVMPWNTWQHGSADGVARRNGKTRSVLTGLAVYHRRTAPLLRPHMRELAHGQRPETLFITCADSRVVPNVITSSGPGDLFTVRNVGNLVPAADDDASTQAAIAFAVDKLEVSSIVVCGHSGCGAMNALLAPGAESRADAYLRPWLSHGRPTLTAFADGMHPVAQSAAEAGFDTVDQLSMVNVAVQVQTLLSHPLVADAHRQGRIEVLGLFYDIATARVLQVAPTYVLPFEVHESV